MIPTATLHSDGAPDSTVSREVVLCAVIAAGMSLFVLLVVPPGGDLAAHLYRTFLARRGDLVWDNLWFAGEYPLVSYSVLYYLAASLVGNDAVAAVSIVLSVVLFASITLREWGPSARWPIRSFALLAAGQLFTAAYPFDAGIATLLATVWALQCRRLIVAICCAVLTLGFSPLAFLFLAIALTALWLHRRHLNRRAVLVATVLLAAGGAEFGLLAMFPSGRLLYPYGLWRLLAGLAVAGSSAAIALRAPRAYPLAMLFVVWAATSVVAYSIPSAIGHNILRASTFVFPLTLLAGVIARFRPRWLAIPALIGSLAATVVPYLSMIPTRTSTATGTLSFWRPMLTYLRAHATPSFRIEVVPTSNHWEAYFLPRTGYALARGWYRQLDIADNPILYHSPLGPSEYRAWLRREGVEYVLLPLAPLEAIDATREAALLRSGLSGLKDVWNGSDGRIYALPHPEPILSGPGEATITTLDSNRIVGQVTRAGLYTLRVHYTPYWQVTKGSICIERGKSTMTALEFAHAGTFSIRAVESPADLLWSLIDSDHNHCSD